MNLFKKSFIGISILFLFVLGMALVPKEKANALVSLNVWANNTTVHSGGSTRINWEVSGNVGSCTRADTGTVVSTGAGTFYFNTGPLTATRSYTINCTDTLSNSCSGTYTSAPAFCLKSGNYYPQNYSCGTNCCFRSTSTASSLACFTSGWAPIIPPATCNTTCACSGTIVPAVTSSCVGLSQTQCTTAPRSTGSPHCTWNP